MSKPLDEGAGPMEEQPLLSELDLSDLAAHYATRPRYDHFREEVYPLFIEVLSGLAAGSRVLDIGAGPGNLALEFYRKRPRRKVSFVLLDASRKMLKIAAQRLARRPVTTLLRSFNLDGWHEGVGQVDAIVSNNAIFHVRPERLERFYAACHSLLRARGILLNQQSFGYSAGESPYGNAPFPRLMRELLRPLMPDRPRLSRAEEARLADEKKAAHARHRRALEKARSAGAKTPDDQSAYQFLSVERHLRAMRAAGFAAGCIWRKREFAVVCGVRSA